MKKAFVVLGWAALLLTSFVLSTVLGELRFQRRYFSDLPEYALPASFTPKERCPLCEKLPANGPLMVNANLGLVNEVQIFETQRQDRLTISQEQNSGILRRGGNHACIIFASPDDRCARVFVKRDSLYRYSPDAAARFFCEGCLARFETVSPASNYLIVDGYVRENPNCHDLRQVESGRLAIRHYTFSLLRKGRDSFDFQVFSSYFDGGSHLDTPPTY